VTRKWCHTAPAVSCSSIVGCLTIDQAHIMPGLDRTTGCARILVRVSNIKFSKLMRIVVGNV
jgi:hypothetical protein